MAGEIISERRATSNRNGERDHPGIPGDFSRNQHDGIGMSLYSKRLESGRFIWPSPADGAVAISAAQLAYMLDHAS